MKVLEVLTRIYLSPSALDAAVAFYEGVFSECCRLRFQYAAVGLELANVGSVLLIAGTDEALRPFKSTLATFLVDSVTEFRARLPDQGALILEEPKPVPGGYNMRVQHPDGAIIEYVEHTR